MPSVAHYLDRVHLQRLDNYKYSSVDKSPISKYVMKHWWNLTAELMPPWLAPNAITLLGFAAVLLNVLTVQVVVPDLTDGPRWVYFSCAAGLFFYQTMDNIDGRQARKTKSSSPLGELFDHGIDSLNCPLGGLIQAGAMGLGHSGLSLFCILVACWSMYLSTWEEFHTHTLFLGVINGPVEGILIAVTILLWSGLQGPAWWSKPLTTLGINISDSSTILDLMMLFILLAFLVAHLPSCLLNVHRVLASPRQPSNEEARVSLGAAYLQLIPIIAFSVLCALWALSPRSIILSGQHLIEFTLLLCFQFGQMSSKIILAQLTRGVFPFSPNLLLPLALGAIGVNFPFYHFSPRMELYYLHLALGVSLLSYATTSLKIINSICGYLGISCLTIPYRVNDAEKTR